MGWTSLLIITHNNLYFFKLHRSQNSVRLIEIFKGEDSGKETITSPLYFCQLIHYYLTGEKEKLKTG